MTISREQVLNDIVSLFDTLRDDWEYSGEIGPETGLLSDLGFQSLELVVLGVSIQQHYQHDIPFADFLASVGERELPDVYLQDMVDFVHSHVANSTAEAH